VALNIKSAETDRLARELAALTGESITDAVTRALEIRLEHERRERGRDGEPARRARVHALLRQIQSYPVLDPRPADELLGYNEFGTFD
jgi:antitoxin VapB